MDEVALNDASARSEGVVGSMGLPQNAQLPIRSVPSETLARIFLIHSRSSMCVSVSIGTLSLVCRAWRQIVLGTPALWATIGRYDWLGYTPVALERSRSSPLNIHIFWGNWRYFDEFMRHAARLRIVHIEVAGPLHEDTLHKVFDAPALEELELIDRTRPCSVNVRNCSARSPYMRRLHLSQVKVDWDSSVFSNLRVLEMEGDNVPVPSALQLHSLASACPELQEFRLRLSNHMNDTVIASRPVTTFPNLRNIGLFMPSLIACTFLPLLSLPNIRDFYLQCSLPLRMTLAEFNQHSARIARSITPYFKAFTGGEKLEIKLGPSDCLGLSLLGYSDILNCTEQLIVKISVQLVGCTQPMPLGWLAEALGKDYAARPQTVLTFSEIHTASPLEVVKHDIHHFNISQITFFGVQQQRVLGRALDCILSSRQILVALEEICFISCKLEPTLLAKLREILHDRESKNPGGISPPVHSLKRIRLSSCDLTATTKGDIVKLKEALGEGTLKVDLSMKNDFSL